MDFPTPENEVYFDKGYGPYEVHDVRAATDEEMQNEWEYELRPPFLQAWTDWLNLNILPLPLVEAPDTTLVPVADHDDERIYISFDDGGEVFELYFDLDGDYGWYELAYVARGGNKTKLLFGIYNRDEIIRAIQVLREFCAIAAMTHAAGITPIECPESLTTFGGAITYYKGSIQIDMKTCSISVNNPEHAAILAASIIPF